MFESLTSAAWAIAALAVILNGISKSGFGSAFGGIAVPLLALFMPVSMAAAVMLPILVVIDAFGIRAYWRQWSAEDLRALIPGAVVGIVIGTLAFGLLPEKGVKGLIGTIAVVFALDRVFGLRNRLRMSTESGRVAGAVWGTVAGFTSTLAHAGGPPVLVYLLGRSLPKHRFVATTVVFFMVINLTKLIPYAALGLFTRDVFLMSLVLIPLVPVGVWLGVRAQRSLPEKPFFFLATAALGLSGLKLIWDALA